MILTEIIEPPISGSAPETSLQLTLKKCSCCGEKKPLNAFYSKGTRKDSSCKDCIKKTKKKNRLCNIERQRRSISIAAIDAYDQFTIFEQMSEDQVDLNEVENILRKIVLEAA